MSHTLYADDIMIFYKGDQKYLNAISNFQHDYANCSGQLCSKEKSIIYAGGMTNGIHKALADLMGFKMTYPPFIYLGAPIFVRRPEAGHFLFIADKIKIKLVAWKTCLLSMAGRVWLVKAVILSMTVHCISVYNWHASLINKMESWMRNFIWSGCLEKKKLVRIA